MADEGTISRLPMAAPLSAVNALLSVVDKVDDNSSTSSVFADTECAQALLELSHSFTTACSRGSHPIQKTSVVIQHGKSKAGKTKVERTPANGNAGSWHGYAASSILKRHLEETDNPRAHSIGAKLVYTQSLVVKLDCSSTEELRKELVKRVKLDHNYICNGDYSWNRMAYEKESSQGIYPGFHWTESAPDALPKNGRHNSFEMKKSPNSKRTSPDHKYHSRSPSRSIGSFKAKTSPGACASGALDGKPGEPSHIESIPDVKVEPKEELGAAKVEPVPSELYQPNDSKYKNFNLLLKCLTTDEAVEEAGGCRERCDSTLSSLLSTDNSSGSSEDGIPITDSGNGEELEYHCQCCCKVFLKKRYLTKHVRRMHPDALVPEFVIMTTAREGVGVSCPSCGSSIQRHSFRRHSQHCHGQSKKSKKQLEMDLANCQFCGMRMRRHILVKHLAQEHCVDNSKEVLFLMGEGGDDMSESDSSTLSGSEHEQDIDELGDAVPDMPESALIQDAASLKSDGRQFSCSARSEIGSKLATPESTHSSIPIPTGPAPPSPTHSAMVPCQRCGVQFSKLQLVKHLSQSHCASGGGEETLAVSPAERAPSACSHSMLHRFLSESGDDGEVTTTTTYSEECASCMQRLVGQRDLQPTPPTAKPQAAPVPTAKQQPAPVPLSPNNATYTVVVSHDISVDTPIPQGAAPDLSAVMSAEHSTTTT